MSDTTSQSTLESTPEPGAAPRISLTPEAAEFVKKRLAKEGRPRARDLVYEFHGVRVLVDTRSIEYIEGSQVVYENTLMFQGLKFKNPLEASTCGCGETFSVKPEVQEKQRTRALPTKS